MYKSLLQYFWPTLTAAVLVTLLAGTQLPKVRRVWFNVVGLATLAATVMEALLLSAAVARPSANILVRDTVGWFVFSAVAVILPAISARKGAVFGWPGLARAGLSALITLLLVAAAPFILLVVHCASGDCL